VKNEYRSNTYEINYKDFKGPLQALLDNSFRLVSQEEDKEEGLFSARIQITSPGTSNSLLQKLLPHITLISFNEILPTMNDIFIAKVKEQYKR
jgi:ABC-2 type transport system ATP-binding protein